LNNNIDQNIQDERWMRLALKEAEYALSKKEVPIGAVAVHENKVIAKGHNQVLTLNDPTAHAEILTIGAASNYIKNWKLSGVSLYVTIEPCPMCAGAIVLSRLDRLIFGAKDPKAGACGSLYNILQDVRLNHQVEITPYVLEKECRKIIQTFFKRIRAKSKNKKGDDSGI
jgi:tRNA(adenine34) deaminase